MNTIIHSAYFSNEPLKTHTHYHDCHEIILIRQGETEICVNGTVYRAFPGDLVLFSRYENHSVRVLSDAYERFVLQISPFSGNTGKLYALLANRPEGFHNIISVNSELDTFIYLFDCIIAENTTDAPMHDDLMQLLIQELLIRICRYLPSISDTLEDKRLEYIFELQHRFETSCQLPYTLEKLAAEYHLSPSTLSHQFKKITGTSVMDYLLSCRMATAKKYLTGTSMTIGEIVEKCGFSDNSNFSRTFKRQNGISPKEFREMYASVT